MKIGIVVYSQTGNTLSVAQKLRDKLMALGHGAAIERITLAGDPKDAKDIRFNTLPALDGYDALVFAAPVQAFQLCAVMKDYLPKMPLLLGRKSAVLVTKHWTSAWTGANGAMKAIAAAIGEKGGKLCGQGFVGWKSKQRDQEVEMLTDKLAGAF